MSDWSDIDDHGEPELRAEWRAVQDHPPLEFVKVQVPKDLLWLGCAPPQ